jgi:hypothetical protein
MLRDGFERMLKDAEFAADADGRRTGRARG